MNVLKMKSEKDHFISLLDLDSSISINGESFVPLDENENNSEGILIVIKFEKINFRRLRIFFVNYFEFYFIVLGLLSDSKAKNNGWGLTASSKKNYKADYKSLKTNDSVIVHIGTYFFNIRTIENYI